jgi:hypothetical protein
VRQPGKTFAYLAYLPRLTASIAGEKFQLRREASDIQRGLLQHASLHTARCSLSGSNTVSDTVFEVSEVSFSFRCHVF